MDAPVSFTVFTEGGKKKKNLVRAFLKEHTIVTDWQRVIPPVLVFDEIVWELHCETDARAELKTKGAANCIVSFQTFKDRRVAVARLNKAKERTE